VLCQTGCSLNISTCVFSKNSAVYGAAIYSYSNLIHISDSTFKQNTASTAAGAIYIDLDQQQQTSSSLKRLIAASVPTIVNTVFDSNTAVEAAGAILFRCTSLTLKGCTFYGNTAGTSGGAIYDYRNVSVLKKPNDTFKLSNSVLISNEAATQKGGALYLTGTTAITKVRRLDLLSFDHASKSWHRVHVCIEASSAQCILTLVVFTDLFTAIGFLLHFNSVYSMIVEVYLTLVVVCIMIIQQ
jgi:predicted outer membrane repeat protein